MKKIFNSMIALVALLAMLLTSCSDGGQVDADGMKNYSRGGMSFKLPAEYKELSVNYATFSYYLDGVEFFVNIFDKQQMEEELEIDPDISVYNYAYKFIYVWNGCNCDFDYDEENDVVTFGVFYPEEVSDESETREYYQYYITRTDELLYIVTMCCDAELYDTYKPVFDEWVGYISIAK